METTVDISTLTKEEIVNMRFPSKMWILISTPNRVIKWGRNGTTVLIDYIALDEYLYSSFSIFKTKSRSSFIRQMNLYGFQKFTITQQGEEAQNSKGIIYEYRHENFLQSRVDLVQKIARRSGVRKQLTSSLQPRQSLQTRTQRQQQRQHDPCTNVIRALSSIERARLNLRIILQMQAENYVLHKKLSECEQKSPHSAVSVIELPAEAFENPYESISRFEENPDYAGYYGNATTEQIKKFFEEYLPIYAQMNDDDVNETSNETTTSQVDKFFETTNVPSPLTYIDSSEPIKSAEDNQSFQDPSNFQIKYSVSLDSNENKEYTLNILEETCSLEASGGTGPDNFNTNDSISSSSVLQSIGASLEPIFNDCNDESGKEEDISMDQYLKFNNIPQKIEDDTISSVKTMDEGESANSTSTADQIDNPEENDNGTESNFKNFFNQYRQSINLLYD